MYLKNKHDGKWKKSDTEYDMLGKAKLQGQITYQWLPRGSGWGGHQVPRPAGKLYALVRVDQRTYFTLYWLYLSKPEVKTDIWDL